MKLKILVGFSLFITLFVIASLFLIAFLKTPVFLYLYFIFSALFLSSIGASLNKEFPEKVSFSFLAIIILLMAFSLTFFGSSVKNYYDMNKEIIGNLDSKSQIDSLEKTNEYYTEYVAFINGEILKMQQDSLDLQSQIDNFNNPLQNTTQNNPPIIIYEDDEEEEDDD